MSSDSARRGPVALVLFLLLTVYTFSLTLVPIRSDNDVWWHMKSGQYIVEQGLPKHDVFNFNALSLEWHNHEWLSQMLFHGATVAGEGLGIGGVRGLIVFNAVLVWLAVTMIFLFARQLSGRWVVAFLVAVLAAAIGRRMFYQRPPVITNLFLIGEIWLLTAVASGWIRRRWLLVLPPAIALWTNLHGGWMAGGVLLALWSMEQFIAMVRGRIPELPIEFPERPVPFKVLAIVLPLALIATLCNPYLHQLYALPGRVLSDFDLTRSIGELRSPDFYFVIDFELAFVGILALGLLVPRWRPRFFELAIYLFFLHQAIQHVRHLSLFALVMVPMASRILGEVLEGSEEWLRQAAPVLGRAPRFAVAALGLFLMGWVLINPREGGQWTQPLTAASYPGRNLQLAAAPEGYDPGRFPRQLCDFVELAEIRGNVFNENFYAGYLIWRLAPERALVYTDPRFDIFAGDIKRMEEAVVAADETPVNGVPRWKALLSEVDWIIARQGTGLWQQLHAQGSAEWVPVAAFTDSNLEVWIAKRLATGDRLAAAASARSLTGATLP